MTEHGFTKANSGNLPLVDGLMVANFLSSSENFVGAELKGVKNARAGRETYGDHAIGYVQIKRTQTSCTIKARITPEHKVRSKCYSVELVVDESKEVITNAECLDCAASLGGCKHIIALLMWVHRRSEDPAPTTIACYWKKSKLSKVGTDLKFMKAVDLATNPVKSTSMHQVPCNVPGAFLSEVLQEGVKQQPMEMSQLMRHFKPVQPIQMLSVNTLSFYFVKNGGGDAADFFEFCGRQMEEEICLLAERETKIQREASLWHELRYGRITASKIYEASRCKTISGSLMESIFGAKIPDTIHMKRGRDLEPAVLKEVEKKAGKKFEKVGLILRPDIPVIGASPDAICDTCVVEVKCPSSTSTMKNYIVNGKLAAKCFAQIQLQMHMARKTEGLFCIAHPSFQTSKDVDIYTVQYDEDYIESLINDAMLFWESAIFPKIMKQMQCSD